jgi:hypothetical protein
VVSLYLQNLRIVPFVDFRDRAAAYAVLIDDRERVPACGGHHGGYAAAPVTGPSRTMPLPVLDQFPTGVPGQQQQFRTDLREGVSAFRILAARLTTRRCTPDHSTPHE